MTDQVHSNVPGWYMAPNAFIDYGLQYLTGDEFKVLSFMTRHIYGWHDKPERTVSQISLSMIENGYGKLGGTGLSRNTIRKCLAKLVEYGFLKRLTDRDERNGAWWSISDSMSFDKLIERRTLRKQVNRNRTAKGRVAAAEKRAREAGLVSDTDPGLSDNPPPSQSDNQQIKTSSKDSIVDASASDTPPDALPVEKPVKAKRTPKEPKAKAPPKPRERNPLFDAVAQHLFGVDPLQVTNGGFIGKSAAVFKAHSVTEAQTVAEFVAWWKRKYPDADTPRHPDKLEVRLLEYLQQHQTVTADDTNWMREL